VPIYAHKKFTHSFFSELTFIIQSHARISDQIDQFKRGLRIQNNLRHKSRLSSVQVRAQATVAIFIYFAIMGFAISELQLANYPYLICLSLVLMCSGVWFILFKGVRIKWTI
jgi:hypothetical protein